MTTERDHIETAARLLDGDDHAMNDHLHGQPGRLKYCPFCGCTTIKEVVKDENTRWHECDWCQTAGPIEDADSAPPQGWNIRWDESEEAMLVSREANEA